MATIIDPPNSVWPNGLKVDSEGYVTFYPLGTNKVDITTITWPDGDKLVSPFVFQDDKLVGFVDTKAMTVSGSATTTMNYSHIEADFASISEGKLIINAPNAIVKKFKWSVVDGGDDNIIVTIKYKGCKTGDEVKAVDPNYLANDIVDGVWSEGLGDLEDNHYTEIDDDEIYYFGLFEGCSQLTSFTSDLSNLTSGYGMFYNCTNLTSFNSDLSNLGDGYSMFQNTKLTSFSTDLSNLVDGFSMFQNTKLTSFNSDLSNLVEGYCMFERCKLDTASVQNIADTINTPSSKGTIHIGIGNSTPNSQEETAFNTIASKNWTVYVGVNGENSSQWNPTSLIPENGEETTTPIPFWAKSVQSDEEHAQYVDEQGNFYNILGGNYIYGDNLSTYGLFTCEEDAAANMQLTKIERN